MTSCYRNNQLKMNKERETTRNFLKETECTAEPSRILQGRRKRREAAGGIQPPSRRFHCKALRRQGHVLSGSDSGGQPRSDEGG